MAGKPTYEELENRIEELEKRAVESKRAEETVQINEKRYRLLVETMNDGLGVQDQKGFVTYVNDRLCEMLGYSRDELLGHHVTEFADETYKALWKEQMASRKKGNLEPYELVMERKDGQKIHTIVSPKMLVDEKGHFQGSFAVMTDISERKRAEEALRESEEKVRIFMDSVTDFFAVTDKNENLIYVNKSMAEDLGYSKEEMIGMHITEIISEESMVNFQPELKELVEKGKLSIESTWLTRDGRKIQGELNVNAIYDAQGDYMGSRGVFRDITERKQAEEGLQKAHDELERRVEKRTAELVKLNKRLKAEIEERKGAQEALREREIRFKALYHSIPIPVYIWQKIGEDFVLANYNDAGKAMTRGGIVDYVGRKASEMYEDRPEILEDFSRCFDEKTSIKREMPYRLMTTGESKYWHVWYGFVPPDSILVHTEDITERKLAEDALRESEEKFRGLAEHSPNMIFINKSGRVVYANRICEEVMGYTREEFYSPDFDFRVLIAPESAKIVEAGFEKYMKGQEVEPYELALVTKDGKRIEAIIAPKLVPFEGENAVLGVVTDITERKRTEEVLRESEERYRHLLDNITLGVALIDSDHTVVMANPVHGKLLKKPMSELVGTKCFHEFEKREAICPHCPGVQAMATGQPAEVETEAVRDDGSRFDVNVRAFPTFGKDGSVSGFVEIVGDITEKRKLRGELQHAHKLEAVGTLAGGIAHDFNNLLTGIQGNVSLMLMNIDSAHPHYDRLKNVEKQVESGARLTSHLLGYARKGKYEIKPIDLNLLVEETSETFGRTRKQIEMHRDLAVDLSAIEADPGQIEQVLLNLLVNAADAMSTGGAIFLKTMNVTHKNMTGKIYKPKPGDYVMLTVTDAGMGMDKETMERIFDPFFTTKEMGRGTGLGLASAYGIVKGHGGYIDVGSQKGQGTTFSIFLPASEKEVERVVKGIEPVTKGTGTVLLVDDEETILAVGRDLLEALGYEVLLAKDGKEAIEIYRKIRDEIDIVVLDMVMPNVGGGATYDRLKEINPDVKVLLSSGYSIDGEATEILERGCNGFIQKPFTMNELAQRITEILDKK